MRNPNGFGSVSKASGKRRNPYCARITVSWEQNKETGKAKQIYKVVGYFPTREDAIEALSEYHANPYDLDTNRITFEEVYRRWSKDHFDKIVPSAVRTWKSAFKYCAPLYRMRMKDIKVIHLENTIRHAEVGQATKVRMKSLFNLMYKYAMKHEIVNKNYAQLMDSVKNATPQIIRTPFTTEEIDALWKANIPFADMVIVGIYTGWRPQELSILKIADVDLEAGIITGGLKTDAGKNRIVPIHSKIVPLIQERYDEAVAMNSSYLWNDPKEKQKSPMTYYKYRGRFNKVMKYIGASHRPHDTRHTFITLAKNANMNEYILKLIVGHEISDITERIYTHRTIDELKTEIEKI